MIILVLVALGLLTVRVAGGRYTTLASVPLRASWLLLGSAVIQILTVVQLPIVHTLLDLPVAVAALLHMLSYALAIAWLLCNRKLPGLLIAGTGGGMNAVAIVANGGVMPASPDALRIAGIQHTGEHFANSSAVADPRLAFLGDIFAIPTRVGFLANVFSVGDVVLVIGGVLMMHASAGCGWTSRLPGAAWKSPPGAAHHMAVPTAAG